MNANVQLALDELRAERYNQGTGLLKCGTTFCILGVFCDVFRKVTGKGKWILSDRNSDTQSFVLHDDDKEGDVLRMPIQVMKWYGFNNSWGGYLLPLDSGSKYADYTSLLSLNDHGFSFNEIAQFIESNPRQLFAE